ncbi:MAG: Asp-tRNA(Asn)/Glu-tRNA(Gln) amidotransferase subunit GatC [Caldicoprobacterales bacterium]|jgi:aspartyl/glutamyl-tRNA(Asn/Gln) amidotransferase C subunit|nr:aspartyl/glutamyl-tRNA amidotransferase subunit C [Clostridiales bacterium]
MKLTPDYLTSMAKRSQIELTETELSAYSKELGEIFQYIDKLHEVDTESVKPTAFVDMLQAIHTE